MYTRPYDEVEKLVLEDIRCHRENRVGLNPYSTAGARGSWQNGFDGKQPTITDRLDCYQRGKIAAKLTSEVPQ